MLKTYDNSNLTHSLLGARTKPSPNRLSPGEGLPQLLFQQTGTLYNYLNNHINRSTKNLLGLQMTCRYFQRFCHRLPTTQKWVVSNPTRH